MNGALPIFYRLKSPIRDYKWGIRNGISTLFSWPNTDGPEAELWMGAHPSAPSPLELGANEAENLLQLIVNDRERHLGSVVARSFESLPYLFKVLAAAEPLSLQVHPTTAQAKVGFAKEEKAGVPLDAGSRMYKDPRHKPELILSLTPFQALVGFLPYAESIRNIQFFQLGELNSPLLNAINFFVAQPSAAGLRKLVEAIFHLEPTQVEGLMARALSVASEFEQSQHNQDIQPPSVRSPSEAERKRAQLVRRCSNLRRLNEKYPGDAGVVMSLLLRLVELKPGEALFLSAGNLHAYIEGVGLEIMANSDNVLRGGMTPKYVNIPELMKSLVFNPASEDVISGERESGLRRYCPPVDEFELNLVELKDGESWRAQGPDILLMLEGESYLSSDLDPKREVLLLQRGEQIFCSAQASYVIKGQGLLARASVNSKLSTDEVQPMRRTDS